ncbi:TonB-dependent receptor [Pseudomonadota bacterium]
MSIQAAPNTPTRQGESLRRLLFSALLTFVVTVPTQLEAQSGENAVDEERVLEEITVQARRISESLEDVPVSITLMTDTYIESQRIQTVGELLEYVPTGTVTVFNKGQYDYSLRGISSQTEGAAGDSAVLTVVDSVVYSKDFYKSAEFFDAEQVEILRGPQGTSFGRNASAGIIHIINNTPTRDVAAYLETTAGNYSLWEVNGMLNGPIGDSAAGRLAFHYDDRDGYTKDLRTGKRHDDENNISVRGQLLFNPTDSLEILLKAEYSKDDDGGRVRKAPDCTSPYLEPPFGPLFTDACNEWETTNSEGIRTDFGYVRKLKTFSGSVYWDINDAITMTSITAYIDGEASRSQDTFGTPENILINSGEDDASQFTQEFRLDNAAAGSALTWVTGLFYLSDEHATNEDREILLDHPFETFQSAQTSNDTKSLGVFGQLIWDINDLTHLTVGGRYSKDEKDFTVFHATSGPLGDIFVDPAENPISESPSGDWSQTTGSFALSRDVGESSMIYALYSQGYKSGGFNSEPYNAEAANTGFDEETSDNVELGAKMLFLDNRLRTNLTLFSTDYKDLQVQDFLPSGSPIIQNSGGADVSGVEVDFAWVISQYWTLMGSYAHIDAELKGEVGGDDVSGNRPDNSPKWTATFAVQFDYPLANGSDISLRADYRGRSDVFDGPNEDPEAVRPGVSLIGARASWYSPTGAWQASLWAKNLTEEAEIMTIGPDILVSQHPTGYGAPRTYGATVRYNFF